MQPDDDLAKPYQCDICYRRYKHSASLWKHKTYECGKLPQFTCNLCSYRCKQKSSLKSHFRVHRNHWLKKNIITELNNIY